MKTTCECRECKLADEIQEMMKRIKNYKEAKKETNTSELIVDKMVDDLYEVMQEKADLLITLINNRV